MDQTENRKLNAHLSPLAVIAFSIGSVIGWGSLVVTSSSYLGEAGIVGSILGMIVGMAVMLVVARNYSYLMQIYPESGGAYAYSREIFGHDYGFLTAWFLALTYLSILWANATSLPLFARFFIGPVFQFGQLYTIFGYDIYVGEILLTMAGILLTAWFCSKSKKAVSAVMTALTIVLTAAIVIAFAAAMFGFKGPVTHSFVPESRALSQIINIAVISPWAFIGFESVSHSSEEFEFPRTKIFRILVISVIVTTLLYLFVTLLSITAYPERYSSWLEYIRDRGNLSGIEAIPAFYPAEHYLGSAGVGILMAALLSLVITSLIGQTTAASRLFYALGRDRLLSQRFSRLNSKDIPVNAIILIAAVSMIIPFVGRTAIGWIVDVTCIGATIIYGIVSAAAYKKAKEREDRVERITGLIGIVVMILYGLYTLVPNLVATGNIERETYLIFIVWTILGFIFFRLLLKNDKEKKFGGSIIVWVSLLSLVLFISLIWMRQSMIASNTTMMSNVEAYYEQMEDEGRAADEAYIQEQLNLKEDADTRTILMAIAMFGFALIIMFSNHSFMNKRAKESEMLANIDSMTGVKNKHAFLIRSRSIDGEIAGEGGTDDFAVAVCDVNGLKHINDTLGHKAGDEYICAASKMICEIFQHSPVYRVGGDEFVIVLTGHDYDIRSELMQMLHNRSVDNISLGRVVVSGGISEFNRETDPSFHSVFERADELMYKEKMLLKSLGAVTREDGPADTESAAAEDDSSMLRERVGKNLELEGAEGVMDDVREDLTNLFKKEYFWQGVAKYDELYPDIPMDAVMIDINHFHMINERFGRSFGDDVLRHVGISVQNYAKAAGGIACRRSADTFEIYCPHREYYGDIIDAVKSDNEAGRIASVRLRIGVYSNVDKTLRVGQRYDRAKMAADNVKNGHLNNIGYYDDGMYEHAIYMERLLEDFHGALDNGEFEVYMQPKFDIRGKKPVLCGAEALARWNHPEFGVLQPGEFVPMLEDNGRIYELDKDIWDMTAVYVRKWKDEYGFRLPVSVNISRIDMLAPDINSVFHEILSRHGLEETDIVLEITESAYTDDMQNVISVARELHTGDPGFRIEVDDFSAGYTSLGMLSQLPVDAFKMDLSFIRGYFGDDRSMQIVEFIAGMAQKMGVSVVAEGVETEEQLKALKAIGCGFAQGFLFSKPLPMSEFEEYIKSTNCSEP